MVNQNCNHQLARTLLIGLGSLGLVLGFANVARSTVVEIEGGGVATFAWAEASGPVDHYKVQIATESEAPFSWTDHAIANAGVPEISIVSSVASSEIPDLAHWAFDENQGDIASDWTDSGYDGVVNGAAWVSKTPSGTGTSLRFDGVNDSVELGPVEGDGDALTISLWFKADDFDTSDGRLISRASGTGANQHYWMLSTTDDSGPKLRFRLKAGGTTETLVASGALQVDVWTHAVVVYDGAMMRIYKDGVEVASTPKTGQMDSSGSVATAIGNQPIGAGSAPFDGMIDDVRIYDRALSATEIAALGADANSSFEWVTIRTIAYDAEGNSGLPSPVSKTVHFVPPSDPIYGVPFDFDGDSIPDVLSYNEGTGEVVLEESTTGDTVNLKDEMGPGWEIVGQGDFDGDLREDLFWRNADTGENQLWLEVGVDMIEENFEGSPEFATSDIAWGVQAVGDFDRDGIFDLFWQNTNTLETGVWFMDGANVDVAELPRVRTASWVVEASGDFDGSGTDDLLWRNLDNSQTWAWLMDGDRVDFERSEYADPALQVVSVVDQNEDGSMDLIWQDGAEDCQIWLMSGGDLLSDPAPIACPTP